MKTRLQRHASAAGDALRRFARVPVSSCLAILILGVAISMPLFLHKLTESMDRVVEKYQHGNSVTLFLSFPRDIMEEELEQEIRELLLDLLRIPMVEDIRHISREEAFEDFKRTSGLSDILDDLPGNPLPEILVIEPVERANAQEMQSLADRLGDIRGIGSVSYERIWRDRFDAMADLFQTASAAIGSMMGLGVLLIVGNTVRTAVHSRSGEIRLLDQLGATSLFIMRPFLYYGAVQGIAGALMALVLVGVCLHILGEPVNRLAGLYGSDFRIQPLSVSLGAKVLVMSGLLGWSAAGFASATYIRQLRASVRGM